MKKMLRIFICVGSMFTICKADAPTIFVPRQLSYNPIFENAVVCSTKVFHQDRGEELYTSEHFLVSAKPIYTQNVGAKFGQYFTPNNKSVLDVREDGTGDIGSLWFQGVTPVSYYSSELSFNPCRRTLGVMLYGIVNISDHLSVSGNTALINTRNNMNIYEYNIPMFGQVPGLRTITQAFENPDLQYGAISGTQSKSGVDDIQLKLIYHSYATEQNDVVEDKKFYGEAYLLAGIPTGQGSQAQYLFEPLVGSNHAQIGLGGNVHARFGNIKFQAEAKWRYAFAGQEIRSFDLAANGQWSRYLQVVNSTNTVAYYQAVNSFTFPTQVTPRNSFDLYVAAYWDINERWQCELGYDLWVRQAEKISVSPVLPAPSIGIADLYDISVANPPFYSASTANISQGVVTGGGAATMTPDLAFVAIQPTDFNLNSAGAPKSISNSIYATIARTKEMHEHLVRSAFALVYECGHGVNVPNNISVFINMDVSF